MVRLGCSRLGPRSGGRVSEIGWNVLKDELGADQRQTCLMPVRIHLSSFWEVVSKCDSLVIIASDL